MLYTHEGRTYTLDYTYHPADETENSTTVVLHAIWDSAGREVLLPRDVMARMATAARAHCLAESARAWSQLRERRLRQTAAVVSLP